MCCYARGRCAYGACASPLCATWASGREVRGRRAGGLDRLTAHDLPPLGFYTSPRREQYEHSVRTSLHALTFVNSSQQHTTDSRDVHLAQLTTSFRRWSFIVEKTTVKRWVYARRGCTVVRRAARLFSSYLGRYARAERRARYERRNCSVVDVADGRCAIAANLNRSAREGGHSSGDPARVGGRSTDREWCSNLSRTNSRLTAWRTIEDPQRYFDDVRSIVSVRIANHENSHAVTRCCSSRLLFW